MQILNNSILDHQNTDQYIQYVNKASLLIKDWLDGQNLYQGGSALEVNNAIQLDITGEGIGLDTLLGKLEKSYLPNSISTAHPSCLAHLHPPSLLVSQLAEIFITATNQSMDSWNQSPIATSMETQLIKWLCYQCQFDTKSNASSSSAGVFTSGGTQSNLMGLLLARNQFYANQGVNIQEEGLFHQHPCKILCSDQAHFSVEKNSTVLGLGRNNVIKIATDDNGVMCLKDLSNQINKLGRRNIMAIVATAGTTDSGAIDNLNALSSICNNSDQEKIWLHVDAAWGGALLLSHKYRNRIDGLELADSITLDFHKHWFLPISCGAFLLKDGNQYNTIRHHSDYLNSVEDEEDNIPNLVTYSLQTTRRFDALKLWMSLEALGTNRYGELVDICIDRAIQIREYLETLEDIVVLNDPEINGISSVMFYLEPNDKDLDTSQLVRLNRHIAQQLLMSNIANLATTQFKGRFCLKFTILNPNTQMSDINNILKEVINIGNQYCQNLTQEDRK